jgi:hypothetical protein
MIEDAVKIVNGAIKNTMHVNLIINNRAGGNPPPDRLKDRRQNTCGEAAGAVLNSFLSIEASV